MVRHCATQDVCIVASPLVLVAALCFHIMFLVSRPGVVNVETLYTIGVVSQLMLVMMWFVPCLSAGCQTYHITTCYALASAAQAKPFWLNQLGQWPSPQQTHPQRSQLHGTDSDPQLPTRRRRRGRSMRGINVLCVCCFCLYM